MTRCSRQAGPHSSSAACSSPNKSIGFGKRPIRVLRNSPRKDIVGLRTWLGCRCALFSQRLKHRVTQQIGVEERPPRPSSELLLDLLALLVWRVLDCFPGRQPCAERPRSRRRRPGSLWGPSSCFSFLGWAAGLSVPGRGAARTPAARRDVARTWPGREHPPRLRETRTSPPSTR